MGRASSHIKNMFLKESHATIWSGLALPGEEHQHSNNYDAIFNRISQNNNNISYNILRQMKSGVSSGFGARR